MLVIMLNHVNDRVKVTVDNHVNNTICVTGEESLFNQVLYISVLYPSQKLMIHAAQQTYVRKTGHGDSSALNLHLTHLK